MRKLIIFFAFLLLTGGFICLLFTLQIISQSKIPGYDLKVNRFRFIQFLIKNNYYDGEGLWRVADITLTGDRQPFVAIWKDINSPPFQSVTIKKDQKSTTILAHYDSYVLEEQLSLKEDGQKRINQDILSYICVAQTKTKTGLYEKEDCYGVLKTIWKTTPVWFLNSREKAEK